MQLLLPLLEIINFSNQFISNFFFHVVGGLNQAVFLNSYFTIVYLSVKMINGKILFYLNKKTEMNVNR